MLPALSLRMKTGRVLLPIAIMMLLAVCAFLGGVGWQQRSSTESDPRAAGGSGGAPLRNAPAPPRSASVSNTTPTATSSGPISPPLDWPPLPPLDQPVAEVFDDLVERARRGDDRAACRLGAQLQECMRATTLRRIASDIERDTARGDATPQRAIQSIDRLQQGAARVGTRCEGLNAAQMEQAFDWQLRAARSDPALRLWFVLNPALDRVNFVTELERWSLYRQHALPWLEGLAAEGDLVAVIALARVFGDHRRTSPPLPPFRIQDDARFIVYAELMTRYGAEFDAVRRSADAARARLDPQQLRDAQRQVDALHRADAVRHDREGVRVALAESFSPEFDPRNCGS